MILKSFLILSGAVLVSCGGTVIDEGASDAGGTTGSVDAAGDDSDSSPFGGAGSGDDGSDTLTPGGGSSSGAGGSGPDPFDPDDRPEVSDSCKEDCAAINNRDRCPGETDFDTRDCERLCAGRDTPGEPCAAELGDVFVCMADHPEVFMCNGAGDEVIRCGVCDAAFQSVASCGLEIGCTWD